MLKHIPVRGPASLSPEWFALRQFDPGRDVPVILSASYAAATVGCSEWATPAHVFLWQTEPQDEADDDYRWFGRAIEPAIIGRYAETTGHVIDYPQPMWLHPVHRFLAATPDAMVMDKMQVVPDVFGQDDFHGTSWNKAALFPIDAKSTGFRMAEKWGDEGTDEVPVDVLMQAQQQMLVMGANHQEVVQFQVEKRRIKVYPIERNQDLCDAIIEAAKELCERIVRNDPPEPNWTHPRAREVNKALFGIAAESRITADEEFLTARVSYQQALADEKLAVAAKEAAKGKMEWLMGDAASVDLLDGKEMVRKKIQVAEHMVKASEYVRMYERKVPKR
jgi:predicted phage-related endonuclease